MRLALTRAVKASPPKRGEVGRCSAMPLAVSAAAGWVGERCSVTPPAISRVRRSAPP